MGPQDDEELNRQVLDVPCIFSIGPNGQNSIPGIPVEMDLEMYYRRFVGPGHKGIADM